MGWGPGSSSDLNGLAAGESLAVGWRWNSSPSSTCAYDRLTAVGVWSPTGTAAAVRDPAERDELHRDAKHAAIGCSIGGLVFVFVAVVLVGGVIVGLLELARYLNFW